MKRYLKSNKNVFQQTISDCQLLITILRRCFRWSVTIRLHCQTMRKPLEIQRNVLRCNHPNLATTYCNIGSVHYTLGDFPTASSHYKQALHIRQNALPSNHPEQVTVFKCIVDVYEMMGEHSNTLSYYQKSLDIMTNSLPFLHPTLATMYSLMALVHQSIGEYSTALSFYEKHWQFRVFTQSISYHRDRKYFCSLRVSKFSLGKRIWNRTGNWEGIGRQADLSSQQKHGKRSLHELIVSPHSRSDSKPTEHSLEQSVEESLHKVSGTLQRFTDI